MTSNKVEQLNNTRNQSTAQYTFDNLFLGNNDFDEVHLVNTTASAEITVKTGSLICKTAAGDVDVLAAAAKIVDVIGLAAISGDVAVADDGVLDMNVALRGDVAEELIVLPAGITLATVIPTTARTLRDHLNGLGFHLIASVENTKFDNV